MKFLNSFLTCLVLISVVFILHEVIPVYAQSTNPSLTPEQEQALRAELDQIEQQIVAQQDILKSTQKDAGTLAGDIAILNAQIKQAQLKVRAHEISIQNLGKDIEVKKVTIKALSERIDDSKSALTRILQQTEALDNFSTIEAILSGQKMSDFFTDVDHFSNIKKELKALLDNITTAKAQNEELKEQLDDRRNQEIFTKVNVEEEKKKVEVAESQKKKLLSLNKAQQANYQKSISDKQSRATQIRNALFTLRDSASIKFGDAVTYAKKASQATGVRTAFILAVIQQESNLGSNVGACRLVDRVTGSGVKISSGNPVKNLMKPSRDVEPFFEITNSVGRDPYKQAVSCPFSVGYGGAMGPAQFIPSTWMLFKNRLASALGKAVPDPWTPLDAFMASAMYLGDLGAAGGSTSAEKNAACRYYSGKACSGSNTFYGSQVIEKANNLQANIDVLQNL